MGPSVEGGLEKLRWSPPKGEEFFHVFPLPTCPRIVERRRSTGGTFENTLSGEPCQVGFGVYGSLFEIAVIYIDVLCAHD